MTISNLFNKLVAGYWVLPSLGILGLSMYIVYPGGFSNDSFMMYSHAMNLVPLHDEKPVFDILIMKLGMYFFGDGGLLIVNCGLYLLGAMLVSAALFTKPVARMFSSVLLVSYPPLLLVNLTNWIDPIVLSGLSVSIGCILFYSFRVKHVYLLLSAVFFSTYALLGRHNAPSFVFFIQLLIVYLYALDYHPQKHRKLVIIIGTTILFGSSLAINPILNRVLDVHHSSLFKAFYSNDLISISLIENKNLIPREMLREEIKYGDDEEILSKMKDTHKPFHGNPWYVIDKNRADEFVGEALRIILNHPGSFIYTRYVTNHYWLTTPAVSFEINSDGKKAEQLGIQQQRKTKLYAKFEELAKYLKFYTPVFHAWWYLLLAFGLFSCIRLWKIVLPSSKVFNKERILISFLTIAGVFNWLPLVPMLGHAEFRYLIPLVYLVMVSILIVLRCLFVNSLPDSSHDNM